MANRLIGRLPKVGIRPVIDGRERGVRESLEVQTMNMARNAGIMGLAAMPKNRNGIYRPFLKYSKEDLINYANENDLEWREDSSNASNKYRRNILRN